MTRPRLPLVIAAGVAVLAIGGFLVFQQFLVGDSVPALSFAPTTPGASATAEPSVGTGGLSAPVDRVSLTGDLTIHGVTKAVTIAGQARLNGDRIEIVAALTFPFSDFGMTPPSVGGFVQVQNDATLEILLSLAKATG